MSNGVASIRITGNTTEAIAALNALGIKAEETAAKTSKAFASGSTSGKLANFGKIAAAGLLAAGAASVKMAGDFQASMTTLVTGAGESESNLKMVSNGILALAPQVGETTKQLSAGMYMIESAGFHGANGLTVLKAAAQGAKVGGADLGTVADGLTTLLNDYGISAQSAGKVTSELVATVAAGKTHMQDLAGAIAAVGPAASAAHMPMEQVLGAMATMTAKGTPAADAATYLRQTILQLSNPTAKAANEMQSLGLSAINISQNLGSRGLTGTFDLLTNAIQSHMGPAGTVLIDKLKAASTNTTKFQQVLANLPPTQQTVVGALATMVGGTKSMQAALELTGASAETFKQNVVNIGNASADTKGNVQGWANVQKDFNLTLAQARATVEVLAIRVGTVLIPVLEKIASTVSVVVTWFQKHQTVAMALGAAIGLLVATALTAYIASMIAAAAATVAAMAPVLLIVAAIAALGVGIYELVTHWSTVFGTMKAVVGDAWHFIDGTFIQPIETFFSTIVGFIQSHWQLILAILTGPIGLAVLAIKDNFGSIVDFFQAIPDKIAGLFEALPGKFFNIGKDIVTAIVNGIGSMGSAILNAIKSHLPGSGLLTDAFNALPFATGGIVTKPTLALIGEAGPEAVVPLSGRNISGSNLTGSGVLPLPAGIGAGDSNPGGVNVYLNAITNADATDIANEITWALKTAS